VLSEKGKNQIFPYIKSAKAKVVLLQAWGGPVGSTKLRFPDFMTTAQDGGKVVSLMHRLPLPPGTSKVYTSFFLFPVV
jgi:hypothetical protein